jgi:AcrR family transcriptional regulator
MARTRSTEVHHRILHAALALFSERGFQAASMDAIASEARVTKPTLYNHWADKEALMMDVMLYVNGINGRSSFVETGNLLADLTFILTRRPPDEFESVRNRMMPGLIAYSAVHPEFGAAWRRNVMQPAQQELRRILKTAIRAGRLPARLNLDASLALLLGPMLYRHIFLNASPVTIEKLGRETAQAFCRAFATSTPPGRP